MIPQGDSATVLINFCPKLNGPEPVTLLFPNASPKPVSAFSYTFTGTGTTLGVTARTEEAGFSLDQSYPNPTTGRAVITFTLPNPAQVTLRLMDMTGKVRNTAISNETYGPGEQNVNLDLSGLANGDYIYQLIATNSNGQVITLSRKLSLER